MRFELWALLHFWDEFLCAALYGAVAGSCLLWINDIAGRGQWGLKALLYAIGGGAFAGFISPLFRDWKSPTYAELMFLVGQAVFWVGITAQYWRELLPRLKRRLHMEA